MGMFSKRSEIAPIPTELTQIWFHEWADGVRARLTDPEDGDWFRERATLIIDHDCADYVRRMCDRDSLTAYTKYRNSSDVTPWGLVSTIVGCRPRSGSRFESSDGTWGRFIVEDVQRKLARFGNVLVDPSIVQ